MVKHSLSCSVYYIKIQKVSTRQEAYFSLWYCFMLFQQEIQVIAIAVFKDCTEPKDRHKTTHYGLKKLTTLWQKAVEVFGEQGCTVVKALAFNQCGLGSNLAWCHMWVEFVVGSRPAPRVFLRVLWFSSLHKNQHLQIQIRPG